MHPNIEKVLIDEKTLKTRIAEMAAEISKDYEGEELLVIGLLKGASYFMMELTQHLSVPTQIDFLKVSSYGSGRPRRGRSTSSSIRPGTLLEKTSSSLMMWSIPD